MRTGRCAAAPRRIVEGHGQGKGNSKGAWQGTVEGRYLQLREEGRVHEPAAEMQPRCNRDMAARTVQQCEWRCTARGGRICTGEGTGAGAVRRAPCLRGSETRLAADGHAADGGEQRGARVRHEQQRVVEERREIDEHEDKPHVGVVEQVADERHADEAKGQQPPEDDHVVLHLRAVEAERGHLLLGKG